jgi:hypothetical protein
LLTPGRAFQQSEGEFELEIAPHEFDDLARQMLRGLEFVRSLTPHGPSFTALDIGKTYPVPKKS